VLRNAGGTLNVSAALVVVLVSSGASITTLADHIDAPAGHQASLY
jgi:hypothetical protein